jgi:hypothetical protein
MCFRVFQIDRGRAGVLPEVAVLICGMAAR